MQTVTLSPLFRHAIGFDRFSDLFDSALNGPVENNAYPPYNIEKLDEDQYRITMAVAGFRNDDIEIIAQDDTLRITGRSEPVSEEGVEMLYKGIATRAFERTFRLADFVKVTGANLADGLLQISLEREVPEARKPRVIEIGSKSLASRSSAKAITGTSKKNSK